MLERNFYEYFKNYFQYIKQKNVSYLNYIKIIMQTFSLGHIFSLRINYNIVLNYI